MKRRRLLLLALLAFAGAAGFAARRMFNPFQGYTGEIFVDIRRGAGVAEIAGQLETAGVIPADWTFLLLRLARPRAVLRFGEYRFDRPLSPEQVFGKIASGDVFYHSFTVPEGSSLFEIADALEQTGFIGRQEFLLVARRGERVADLAPGARSLEGFLFPDTYRLTRHTTAEELAEQMLKRFRQVWGELSQRRPVREVLQTVTLASLVEEETPLQRERPLVASVFRNRLQIGMRLQCDPTVVYALQRAGRYRGQISREDLGLEDPYNTYVRAGLPPGPIASPGRASLEAALAPAESNYLYFVADNQGGHVFSRSIDGHSQAVVSYRRGQQRRGARSSRARRR